LTETTTEDVVEDEENPADEEIAEVEGRTELTKLKTITLFKVTSPFLKSQKRNMSLAESPAP